MSSQTSNASFAAAPQRDGEILRAWKRLSRLPFGKFLFSRMIGWKAPYTGTIRGRVKKLGPGYARIVMGDRRRVRNHLKSVHAIALMNLAEEASGLAMLAGMPREGRAILTGFTIDYVKKARGKITAESRSPTPDVTETNEVLVPVELFDKGGDVVARAEARWRVGPKR